MHGLASWFLLFRLHKSFLQIIITFSFRHRLHSLLLVSYGMHFFGIFHFVLKFVFESFNVHMCFDNSVVPSSRVSK